MRLRSARAWFELERGVGARPGGDEGDYGGFYGCGCGNFCI